jgi:cytochrome P450
VQNNQPRFDTSLNAWVLSRYADVLAALREPLLSANAIPPNPLAHAKFRRAAMLALSPHKIAEWRAHAESLAHQMFSRLAESNREVDLATEFAEPWSLALAAAVTGVSQQDSEGLSGLAANVFAAAADPFNTGLQAQAQIATAEMSSCMRDAFHVQAFVALSQTLPVFLANAWLTLLQHPADTAGLRAQPDLLPSAMEELLRYVGPSHAQFRHATHDTEINGFHITNGQRVILMLASANRDPAQFRDPDQLNFQRQPNNHLAFGFGEHACVGAALVRMAAAIATLEFLEFFASASLKDSPKRTSTFAILSPISLRVSP